MFPQLLLQIPLAEKAQDTTYGSQNECTNTPTGFV
jgi:hypothetical protein